LGINEPSARQCFEELRERGWIELVRIYIEGRWVTLFRRTILRATVPWGGLAEIEIKAFRFSKCFEIHTAREKISSKSPEHLMDFRVYVYSFEKRDEYTREYMDKLLEDLMASVFVFVPEGVSAGGTKVDRSYEEQEIDFDEVDEVVDSRHILFIKWRHNRVQYEWKDDEFVKRYKPWAPELEIWRWLSR
jgi:hypothetical protein